MSDSWGPEVDDFPAVVVLQLIHLGKLQFGAVERDPQSFSIAEPALLFGFGDAFFAAAKTVGASWADIGRAVGISRQSAHERWEQPRSGLGRVSVRT